MPAQASPGLTVVRVEVDADLQAMIAVRAQTDSDLPPPRIDNLRHNLASNPDLTYLVARADGAPAGTGFVELSEAPTVDVHVIVVPEQRRRGIGSALLAEASRRARERGKASLQGEVREDDADSRAFFERRGYEVVGGEQAVALELAGHEPAPVEPPDGVTIFSREERPDTVEGMYAVALDAGRDIPGYSHDRSFEAFRAQDVDRPSIRPDLCFVALAGHEVIGYAILNEFGREAHHNLTAVKRAWRRRGVATALKRAQIAAAKAAGFQRLVTESETRNLPMRSLNEKLGYRPAPSLSVVVLRGPLL